MILGQITRTAGLDKGMEEQQETNWARIAAWVFGCWAVMIPVGVLMVRAGMSDLVTAQKEMQIAFNTYAIANERRITQLEERQLVVLHRLGKVEERHDDFDAQRRNVK